MATVNFQNTATSTVGELPNVGDQLPSFTLVGTDLGEFTNEEFAGKRVILNVFPSLDTGVCAASVRRFNELASELDNTVVVGVSKDLPMAQGRFCEAEGIENVTAGSAFRTSFGEDYGLTLEGSPLQGLLARAVVVADENGKVVYTQLVDEITTEPDYDSALEALK
ncbi:thiol peroxidase [Corynebacterium halotolerans]|uniref:Thiol peroxidase n=1 Tax=Corynebacterium halotolerans YIM 70093 = DSM 44683 TaxID=1121362 RepID=M1NT16_9CORY|nr:thiol peroxidase [Corynebacterium halotolerans]AGF72607.1 lipid hydroperoxide peroxidase [Corynebacterium halotolerans YIM 70093 = DSM 44683]